MTNKTAASRYARALFDVAVKERVDLEALEGELAAVANLFSQHASLEKALLNPAVPAPRKRAILAQLVKRVSLSPVLAKLLALLAERHRLVLVPDLLAAYRDRLLDYRHVARVEITTPTPLAPERVSVIERSLARLTGGSVRLSTRVDAALIGGLVARVGGTVYDASVTMRLKKMRQKLMESV